MDSIKKILVVILVVLCYALGATAQTKSHTAIFTAEQVGMENHSRIESTLSKASGVASVKVDVSSKSVIVTYDDTKTTLDSLTTTLVSVAGKTTLKSIDGKTTKSKDMRTANLTRPTEQ